jgi:transcriptional repressor NrdR
MRCPFCSGTDNRVVDSRVSREGRAVRRRRECLECHRRFTTYEYVEERPLLVIKRDGSTERYDRRKVVQSIELPCVKRPIAHEEIEAMVDEVEDELARRGEDEVESRVIGELVMERLKARDHVAYVRFASVYRNFQDLEEFYEELRELTARRARAAMSRGQAELPFIEPS